MSDPRRASFLSSRLTRDAIFPWDLNLVLKRIAKAALHTFEANLCVVFAVNPVTNDYFNQPTVIGDGIDPTPFNSIKPRPEGLTQQVLNLGPQIFEDLEDHEVPAHLLRDVLRETGVESLAGIPLKTFRRKKPLAVVYIGFQKKSGVLQADRELLELFSEHASSVLQSTWLLRRYRELTRIAQEINEETQDLSKLFERLQERIPRILDIGCCLLLGIFTPRSHTVEYFVRLENQEQKHVPRVALRGLARSLMEKQQPVLIRHYSEKKPKLSVRIVDLSNLPKSECLIFVPLVSAGVFQGVLSIQHPEPGVYDSEDLQLLTLLASHVSLALSNLRLHTRLRELNDVGQSLTKQLSSEDVLADLVKWIRGATGAALTVLYPFTKKTKKFDNPYYSGRLLDKSHYLPPALRTDDIASLAIQQEEPIFAVDSATVYEDLGGVDAHRKGNFAEREKVVSTAIIPLRVDKEPVGVLFLNYRKRQIFDEPNTFFFSGLGSYAAIAIKNSREFGALARERLRELELIQNIDQQISKPLGLEEVAQAILEIATKHVRADEASIMIYEERTNTLTTTAATGAHRKKSLRQVIPVDGNKGLTREAYVSKEPVLVNGIMQFPNWKEKHITVTSKVQSELDYPIMSDGTCLGVINLESYRNDGFNRANLHFLGILAGQVVLAIKKAQAFEREKRLALERQEVLRIHRIIAAELSESRVLQMILEKALDLTEAEAGCLYVYNSQKRNLELAHEIVGSKGIAPQTMELSKGILGWVATTKELFNHDILTPPWSKIYRPFLPGAQSEIAVPMLQGDTLCGVLNVESREPRHFSDANERLLTDLASLAVIALQNARSFRDAEARRRNIETLHEVERDILRHLPESPEEVIFSLLRRLTHMTKSNVGVLDLFDDQNLKTRYQLRIESKDRTEEVTLIDNQSLADRKIELGIISHVAKTRCPYITYGDAQKDSLYRGRPTTHSEIAAPLISKENDELIGVLDIQSNEVGHFTYDDITLLQHFATHAVIAIQLWRSYLQTGQERRRFEVLYLVGRQLSSVADFESLTGAVDLVAETAKSAGLGRLCFHPHLEPRPDGGILSAGTDSMVSPFAELRSRVGSQGTEIDLTTIINNNFTSASPETAFPIPSGSGARSMIIAAIQIDGRYLGDLEFTKSEPKSFSEADVDLATGLAGQLALNLHRLEIINVNQQVEKRAREAEVFSWLGKQAYELPHRLGNDLGAVEYHLKRAQKALADEGIQIDKVDRALDKISRGIERVFSFTDDYKQELAEYRATGIVGGKRQRIPLRLMLEHLAFTFEAADLASRGIKLRTTIEPDLGDIEAVGTQIENLLTNLIQNSIEAMPNGGTLTIEAKQLGTQIKIEIGDTGVGIGEDDRDKVWDPFYSSKGGAGFGLYSARRNAEIHNGVLDFRSEIGRGTVFTLILPRLGEGVQQPES